MQRILLKSKIHSATVTDANLKYEGSVTIDTDLLDQAGIIPYEQVEIYNITNGKRLTTYAIEGAAGSGEICINGAAAHLVEPGHQVIIANYGIYAERDAAAHRPRIIIVNESNRPVSDQAAAAQ